MQLKSLKEQTCKAFDVIIIDGKSNNRNDIEKYCHDNAFTFLKYDLVDKWNKSILNNIGIRNAKTPYIMTTDADIFFADKFTETLIKLLDPKRFIESRAQYINGGAITKVYNREIDPIHDEKWRCLGRTKKRTTCGGLQCAHIDLWNKIRGYDERYVGWGSEDMDLMSRMKMAGAKIVWMGEGGIGGNIMVFHQPHLKKDIKMDLRDQLRNQKMLNGIQEYVANKDGWGGKK